LTQHRSTVPRYIAKTVHRVIHSSPASCTQGSTVDPSSLYCATVSRETVGRARRGYASTTFLSRADNLYEHRGHQRGDDGSGEGWVTSSYPALVALRMTDGPPFHVKRRPRRETPSSSDVDTVTCSGRGKPVGAGRGAAARSSFRGYQHRRLDCCGICPSSRLLCPGCRRST
jgi:hypothetical protein